MSCSNYMKSQISLGEPHSIEGHHRPALSRLARVPRPAYSESAKQQWVCKKRVTRCLEGASSRAPKDCKKGASFESTLLGEISSAQGLTVKCLDGILLGNLVSEQTFASNWCLRQWPWLKLCIPNLALCIRQASQPQSGPATPKPAFCLDLALLHYGTLHDVPGWIHFTFRLCWFSGGSILKHTLRGSNSSPQNWKVRNPASQLQLWGVPPENADLRP